MDCRSGPAGVAFTEPWCIKGGGLTSDLCFNQALRLILKACGLEDELKFSSLP